MKIVINVCHGGFGLSEKAICDYAKRKNIKLYIEKTEPWGVITHFLSLNCWRRSNVHQPMLLSTHLFLSRIETR